MNPLPSAKKIFSILHKISSSAKVYKKSITLTYPNIISFFHSLKKTGTSSSISQDKISISQWKQIIKSLSSLVLLDSIGGAERMIIVDFLDYVNKNFSFLNPYDNLALCKTDYYLIYQRLKTILEKIPKSGEVVYQPRWKTFYLETGFQEIRMVIFRANPSENDNKYDLAKRYCSR